MITGVHQILFDFDYTLVDSSEGIIAAAQYALQKEGLPPADCEVIRKMIGHSLEDLFYRLTSSDDEALIRRCKETFMHHADSGEMIRRTTLLPDVENAIRRLYENFITLGIVSTKRRSTIEQTLAVFELEDYFDVIIGYEDVQRLKPDPEGLLKAIDELAGNIGDSLYIGDSCIDAETARRAQVRMIGVTTGKTTDEELRAAGAGWVVNHLQELCSLLNI